MQPFKPLIAGIAFALVACSGTAQESGEVGQYRTAFLERCAGDGTARNICECGYDGWVAGLDDPASPAARAAARIYANAGTTPPDPQDIMTGMSALQAIGPAMAACVGGDFDALSEDMGNATENDGTEEVMRRQLEMAGRGDLAGVLGDGRYDLEDLRRMDEIEQARRTREAEEAADARAAEQAGMDALYARRDAANDALMQGDPTARPVSAYEDAFALNCRADGNEAVYCGCKWSAFLGAAGGKDDPATRVAALMASVPAGDLSGVDGETRSQAFSVHQTYVERASRTFARISHSSSSLTSSYWALRIALICFCMFGFSGAV